MFFVGAFVVASIILSVGYVVITGIQERSDQADATRIAAEKTQLDQKAQSFQEELSQLSELQVGIDKSVNDIVISNNSVPKLCNEDPSGCEYFKKLNRERLEESFNPALKNAVSAYNDFAPKIPSDVLDYAGYPQKYGDDGKPIQ